MKKFKSLFSLMIIAALVAVGNLAHAQNRTANERLRSKPMKHERAVQATPVKGPQTTEAKATPKHVKNLRMVHHSQKKTAVMRDMKGYKHTPKRATK